MQPNPLARDIARRAGPVIEGLRQSVYAQALAVWRGLPAYREQQLQTFIRTVTPIVLSGQQVVSDVSSQYVAEQLALYDLQAPSWTPYRTSTGAVVRNGVAPQEVYARPFKEVWTSLSRGADVQEAVNAGETRLGQLIHTDMQLAHDHAVRDMFKRSPGDFGYRRVLVGAKNCALCIVASTQRYHRANLMPIHPACDCRVEPAFGEHVLDQDLLDQVHSEIAARFGISDKAARKLDYRKITLTREHGEYGPTLTYSGDRFTGPDDLLKPGPRYDRAR